MCSVLHCIFFSRTHLRPSIPLASACDGRSTQPGETVLVRSRSWYTDGRLEYVPQGHVWLEGDNASNSTDSRAYGPVPLAMVRGRVFLKVRPHMEEERHVSAENFYFCFRRAGMYDMIETPPAEDLRHNQRSSLFQDTAFVSCFTNCALGSTILVWSPVYLLRFRVLV